MSFWHNNFWQDTFWQSNIVTSLDTDYIHIFSTVNIAPSHLTDTGNNVLIKGGVETQSTSYFSNVEINDYIKASSFKTGALTGASGTFSSSDGKTITVTNGIITSIA